MNSIENLKILSLLPSLLQQDDDIIAASKSLDKANTKNLDLALQLNFFSNKNLENNVLLDALAYDFHVDFYDKSYSTQIKRQLIDDSLLIHAKKGTAQSVEELITTIFGEGVVEEWFEYDGAPFHFRVITNNEEVTTARAQEFIKALESVKRKTAILDSVTINQVEEMNIYVGFAVHFGDKYLFKQVI